MKPVLKIEVDWSQHTPDGNHPAQGFLDNLKSKMNSLATEGEINNSLLQSESCQYVFWGCGSCSGDQARVDAYCSSSGGSTPDASWCEPC